MEESRKRSGEPLVLTRTLYVCSRTPSLENIDEWVSLVVFPSECRTASQYAYFRSLLRGETGGGRARITNTAGVPEGVETFFKNKVYEGIFEISGVLSPIGSLFSRMVSGIVRTRDKLVNVKMYQESSRYLMVSGYEKGRSLFPEGQRYDLLLLRDSEWSTFNVLTFGMGRRSLEECLALLTDMKETALRYTQRSGWHSTYLYFHCHPMNSIPSLHLHIRESPRNKCNDLPLDAVYEALYNEFLRLYA